MPLLPLSDPTTLPPPALAQCDARARGGGGARSPSTTAQRSCPHKTHWMPRPPEPTALGAQFIPERKQKQSQRPVPQKDLRVQKDASNSTTTSGPTPPHPTYLRVAAAFLLVASRQIGLPFLAPQAAQALKRELSPRKVL